MKDDIIKHIGDCRDILPTLPEKSVDCCVTSPPYWGLRDYGVDGQIGQEPTPEEFIEDIVEVFRGVWRVLKDEGTLWLNLGDSYCGTGDKGDPRYKGRNGQKKALNRKIEGLKSKNLIGIPWRVALALQQEGWYLRSDIIWSKPNPMPESVKDRPTNAHEHIFLLSKQPKYFYDYEAIKEPAAPDKNIRDRDNTQLNNTPGRTRIGGLTKNDYELKNKRNVWHVPLAPYKEAHFAAFPPKLIEPCILAGCPEGGTVLDPFGGSGTTAMVAVKHRRKAVLIELNPKYEKLQDKRTTEVQIEAF